MKDIFKILNSNKTNLLFFHIILSLLALLSKFFLVVWMIYSIASFFINRSKYTLQENIIVVSYIVSMEVACRITKTSPFVPYELGKYLLIIFPIISGKINNKVVLPLICFLPAVIMSIFKDLPILLYVFNIFSWIAFVLFGNVNSTIKITKFQLVNLLYLIFLASLAALITTYGKAVDLDEMEFSYDANFGSTGGFQPNQLASIFGLGIAIGAFLLLNKTKVISNWYIIAIILFLIFRGILTFSRGGMFVGFITILLIYLFKLTKEKFEIKNLLIIFSMSFSVVYFGILVDDLSDGHLFKRLQGKTNGTELGIKDQNLNTLTTGRLNIFEEDVKIFSDNPVFGVGIHQSAIERSKNSIYDTSKVVASHVELSRLLADQGLLGLFFFIWILYVFRKSYKSNKTIMGKSFVLFAFSLAILTTFHSCTRTFLTPLMGGLGMLRVIEKD